MIAKRIEFRNVNVSSFSKLTTYITNGQGKNERVGEIRITNCQSEQPAWAAIEAEAVQANNKRTKMDKTYHLLLSFREGDYPTAETLHAIEDRICAKLGYGEHQRVSAVHYDTDHMHIHIAINKIHPTRYTAHEPYFDKRNLGVLCEALEKEYGLAADNHIPRMSQGEAKAQDMEKSAGVESLIGWVKRECLSELLAATSWDELHKQLALSGLELLERGNGLVIKGSNGIAAKASSINRGLSKNALEKRFGAFCPATLQNTEAKQRYEVKPMASKVDTSQLWALYQHERLQHKQRHGVLKDRAKQRKERRVEMAKKSASLKRASVNMAEGKIAKTLLYHAISTSFAKEMQAIQKDYREDQQRVYEKGKHVVWYDWLKAKAWEGNTQALEVLRNRYEREAIRVNAIGGESIDKVNYRAGAKIEAVTKRGTIHYQVAQTVLRDDGKIFKLAENVSPEVIETALKMSMQRFGQTLSVNGSEAFRQQVVEVVVNQKLPISFTDTAMEMQKNSLLTVPPPTPLAPPIPSSLTNNDAALRYIEEQNDKLSSNSDAIPHRLYVSSDAGKHVFAGLIEQRGDSFMLLKTASEILVLPTDIYSINTAKRLKKGSRINVNSIGMIRSLSLRR